jgi:hypothetical protein
MMSPNSQDHESRRHLLIRALAGVAGAALLATALWLCVAVLPQRLYPPLSTADLAGLPPADQAARREGRAKIQNDARTTLLQGLAALLVLSGAGIGAAVTLRQVRIGREQLQQAREQAQRSDKRLHEQISIALEGQITDRYTKAVEQLGHSQLAVRLGAVYALRRVAHDSVGDRLTISEVLCAFVRTAERPQFNEADPQHRTLDKRAPDIHAALRVLGDWHERVGEDEPWLDLHGADLRGANLDSARLVKAYLYDADLREARLCEAILEDAQLDRVDLRKAELHGANLDGASLYDANLECAKANENTSWSGWWADRKHREDAGIDEPPEEVRE